MITAAILGDLDQVSAFDAHATPTERESACFFASANGHVRILEFFQQKGVQLSALAPDLITIAAANGRLEVLRCLKRHGWEFRASPDAPLLAAASHGKSDVLKYLHDEGSSLEACRSVAEHLLVSPANKQTIAYLAENGINPAGPRQLDLIRAARSSDIRLLESNLRYATGSFVPELVVKTAALSGGPAVFQILQRRGFDIRCGGDLALRVAAENGNTALVEYLLEHGADVHANGDEALKVAAENGQLQAVIMLLTAGANPSALGEAELALVELNGHRDVLHYLADRGADPIRRFRSTIAAMHEEINGTKPIYRPSRLWEFFNAINMAQLERAGLGYFKRTVNQNYFNFIPTNILDPQLRKLAWRWFARPTATPFKLHVVDPDLDSRGKLVGVDTRVFSLAHKGMPWAIVARVGNLDPFRWFLKTLYRWLVALLWDAATECDRLGLAGKLTEPRVGSPIETLFHQRLVSQDLAHSIMECNSIFAEIEGVAAHRPLFVAEVGAGYGRLADVIIRATKCRYAVFDIPPGLFVSQWYLGQLFPEKRIFRFRHFDRFEEIAGELEAADLAFFCANQIEQIPDAYFDLSINISSLHELKPAQISNMLEQIYRVTNQYVYLKQYREYVNPYDNLVIGETAYVIAPGWKRRYRRVDQVDPRFFETLIEAEAPRAPSPWVSGSVQSVAAIGSPRKRLKPTVTVLLTNYNHAQFLPTSLTAICNQTVPPTELVVVDDGSTDDSVDVIRTFAGSYPGLKLIRNSRNMGQLASIQRALAAASSEYVVWASSDDLLLPTFLERSLSALEDYPEAGLCFSRLSVFVDGASEVRHFTGASHGAAFEYGNATRFIAPQELVDILKQRYLWISGNTVVARRSALLEINGFEKSLRWHSDWFAFYVVALRYGACVIPDTLAMMRERQGTYSGGGINNPAEQRRVINAILDIIDAPKYRDVRAIVRRRPSLLSLFGKRGLYTALRNPRHWRTAWSLAWWHGPKWLSYRYRQLKYRLVARLR